MDVLTLAMAKSYTDSQKLAYTEKTTAETVILSEMSVNMDNYNYTGASISLPRPLVPGETYIVKYDGVEYECEAKAGVDTFGSDIFYVGISHKVLYGGASYKYYIGIGDEPPFFVGYLDDDGHEYARVAVCNDGKTHTISVYQRTETETIHPIDPKYLPGVCLPVVELSTALVTGSKLTEAEGAAMNEVVGMPVIIKAGAYSLVLSYAHSGTHLFAATISGNSYVLAYDSGTWVVLAGDSAQ